MSALRLPGFDIHPMIQDPAIIQSFVSFLSGRDFPCLAARSAIVRKQVRCAVFTHMACPADDADILHFLYDFIMRFRASGNPYHSAAVIFRGPATDEEQFETLLWTRLQAISDLDAENFGYDPRVKSDPSSPAFSFSLMEEALYVIGMHPGSSRRARRFAYPALVFNPHHQFELLREKGQYEKMREVVRKRDLAWSGSVNPMLADFGVTSEAMQYSGRLYESTWQCPFKPSHGSI